ncbi:molybdate ABC transporter substrate-binding protein [Streptacidiphilus jiangxiensis]|uniref:Molybdate transport system substrate-binding protein n=1 Tax=Streptacidiphilus jiangxiensis TaxID=235985 RepID=A0A1H7HW15_STRJI|nr:molybdate ABC transporter substrate-binding protein [Streptacidiphilus jiangxiensis]SEK53807.1 molybdate transport system substrate-binding protein [Streptacidiphilus jiangxiensis]
MTTLHTATSPRLRRAAVAATAAVALLGLAACSSSSSTGGSSTTASASAPSSAAASGAALSGKVTVFAAASLKKTFTELGKEFEAAHPGVTVSFNFGGSDTLAASIVSGAPADVFAAASTTTMKTVVSKGDAAGTPVDFAKNELEIAVAKGNPKHLATLSGLTASGVKVALCAKTVPCGAAAVKALDAAGVKLTPVTLEQDVTSALNKVELGEVDAALVYKTDVQGASGKVTGVDFPEAAKAITTYPIVALKGSSNAATAQAFAAFVASAQGEQVLSGAGFMAP